MIKKSDRKVKVHSCLGEICLLSNLNPDRKYYSDDPNFKFFRAIPVKCRCKKEISQEKSKQFIEIGKAFPVYKPKLGKELNHTRIDRFQIVMPLDRSQTPRVDLITKADIERAYVDGQQRYQEHIEEVHKMIMKERAKLILDHFIEDPCEGRLLFPFGPDQRTTGGH